MAPAQQGGGVYVDAACLAIAKAIQASSGSFNTSLAGDTLRATLGPSWRERLGLPPNPPGQKGGGKVAAFLKQQPHFELLHSPGQLHQDVRLTPFGARALERAEASAGQVPSPRPSTSAAAASAAAASAAPTSSSRAAASRDLLRIQAAARAVWPSEEPLHTVKHAAAAALYEAGGSLMAPLLGERLNGGGMGGSWRAAAGLDSLVSIVRGDLLFDVAFVPAADNYSVTLKQPELLAAALKTSASATAAAVAAAPAARATDDRYEAAARAVWPSDSPLHAMKRATAAALRTAAGNTMSFAALGHCLMQAGLDSSWRAAHGLTAALQQLFEGDTCFSVTTVPTVLGATNKRLTLNLELLLQQAAGSGGPSSAAARRAVAAVAAPPAAPSAPFRAPRLPSPPPPRGPPPPPPPQPAADEAAGQPDDEASAGLAAAAMAAGSSSLAGLFSVDQAACAAAQVVELAASAPAAQLASFEQHISACGAIGLDLEHAESADQQRPAPAGDSSQQAAPRRRSSSEGGQQEPARVVALAQVFAPAAAGFPATIYLVQVPGDSMQAEYVASYLTAALHDPDTTKVMHDCRRDSQLLAQQFGIQLAGVLDTQVLAGWAALGPAALGAGSGGTPGGGEAQQGAGLPEAAADAASAWVPVSRHLGRVGLGRLYAMHGFAHPSKEAMHAVFEADPRLWLRWPLTPRMASYAADDVRYLLPLAQRLLVAQAPALGALSTLAAQLTVPQQRQQLLALRPELAERYAPLLAAAEQGGSGDALLQFELRLGEGFAPSYRLYVPEEEEEEGGSIGEDGSGAGDQGPEAAAPAAAAKPASPQLPAAAQQEQRFARFWKGGLFRRGGRPRDQLGDVAAACGAEQLGGSCSEAAEELDADVCSMLEVLPGRLAALLAPYRSASHAPALLEIQLDASSQARAVVSDQSTPVPLGLEIPLLEALKALAVAHARAAELQRKRSAARLDQAADGTGGESEDADAAGLKWRTDNRLALPDLLHRISAVRNTQQNIVGLTYRVGRHRPGVGRLLLDHLSGMAASLEEDEPRSLLLLGRPGMGKTTLLRDIARLMSVPSEEGGLGLRVVVIDTSNEIAGDGDKAHACIGWARRMQVPTRAHQHRVMLEAVQNHTPQVLIIDEIGTKEEVAAAKTISQRGVLLVATAHGTSIQTLMKDSCLVGLVGGVKDVTLGDIMAKADNRGLKTRLERSGAPTFTSLLELQARNRWRLHPDVASSVDELLLGEAAHTQVRSYGPQGELLVRFETARAMRRALDEAAAAAGRQPQGPGPAPRRGFTGAWLLGLVHATVHRAIGAGC